MSIGGKSSQQKQKSFSQSASDRLGFNQSQSFVDPNQQPFLDQLRTDAFGQYGLTQPMMNRATRTAYGQQGNAVGNLMGLGNTQQVIGSQLTGLRSGLEDIYNQGMLRIGDAAEAAGAFGGSRHALQEAALGGEIGDAFTQGYGDIIANASRQAIDANNSVIAGAGQTLRDQLLGNYGGLQALAGILGSPTILQDAFGVDSATARGTSRSSGSGQSAGFELGFSAK